MSNARHALGVLCAGVLAFGALLAAVALTAPGAAAPAPDAGQPSTPADEGAVSPTAQALVGRWASERPTNDAAFLEFSEHGLWSASDGCNATSGSWALEADGALTTTGGAMTQIGCDNDPVIAVLSAAVSAAATDDQLTLRDDAGVETRLVRVSDDAFTLPGMWVGPGDVDTAAAVSFSEDGSWSATVGCSSQAGTWELVPLAARAADSPDSLAGHGAGLGAGILRIGAITSTPLPDCAGTDQGLPGQFEADTEYWFGFTPGQPETPGAPGVSSRPAEGQRFFVTPVAGTGPEPELMEFTRVAVAAG